MKSQWRHSIVLMVLVLGAPSVSLAQERQERSEGAATRAPAPSAPAREVDAGKDPAEAALLLPAVQKVQPPEPDASAPAAQPRDIGPAAQRGIEPDEIDRANRATNRGPAGTARAPGADRTGRAGSSAAGSASVQQMMLKLRPRQAGMVALGSGGGGSGPGSIQAAQPEPPKYEIADCGTATSPMICCHHEQGDGSSCNLFKILCKNAGGTAQGDGESAACSDW